MAIAFLTSAVAQDSTAAVSTLVVTVTINPADQVVVAVGSQASNPVLSITDNAATPNTYVRKNTASNGGTNSNSEIWVSTGGMSGSATTLTITFTSATKFAAVVGTYSGVLALGASGTATGSTANPTITLTTQDADNFVVASLVAQGITLPTSLSGTLENSIATSGGGGTTNVSVGLVDNTDVNPSPVTCSEIRVANLWSATCAELRTANTGSSSARLLASLGVGT